MWGKKRVYLDVAAGMAGNPSSPHLEGRAARERLERARKEVARLVEVQSDDVIFTSGATEANALAILGQARALRARAGRDVPGRNNMHVLYLPSSHASIIENVRILADEGVAVEPLPVRDYRVDTDALARMLREETVLVVMDAVCGETGVVWNTREVAEVLRGAREAKKHFSRTQAFTEKNAFLPRALLHVDASQAPLTEKITRDHFGADTLAFDGAKVGAMHGIGALIARRAIPLVPLYGGGGQERGLRPGTESPELAEKFAASLRDAALGREAFRDSARASRARLIGLISNIPGIFIQEGRAQAPNILSVSLPGRDTDYLLALLDEDGFAVSSRSACETDSEEGSRAVYVLTGDKERARAAVRVSWGPRTRFRDLARFAAALARETAFLAAAVDSNRQG